MLVLTRRPGEAVSFPSLGATVRVVALKGRAVRLAIDAPDDVAVLREELQDRLAQGSTCSASGPVTARLRAQEHALRNHLNSLTLGLALLRQQTTMVPDQAIQVSIDRLEAEIRRLTELVEQRPPRETVPMPPPGKRANALVVEDNANERDLLAGMLRMSGFRVETANDGVDALARLNGGWRPDVILLDMGLPHCDGPTTAREIRRSPTCRGVRIVAVTGHAPDEYDLPRGPAGIDRWFRKPVDPVVLVDELRRELAR